MGDGIPLKRKPGFKETGLYMKLTKKQKDFVDEYLRNGYDGPKAAMKAYGRGSSATLLKNPNIRAVIKANQAEVRQEAKISQQKLADMYVETYDLAKKLNKPQGMSQAIKGLATLLGLEAPSKSAVDVNVKGDLVAKILEARKRAKPKS